MERATVIFKVQSQVAAKVANLSNICSMNSHFLELPKRYSKKFSNEPYHALNYIGIINIMTQFIFQINSCIFIQAHVFLFRSNELNNLYKLL